MNLFASSVINKLAMLIKAVSLENCKSFLLTRRKSHCGLKRGWIYLTYSSINAVLLSRINESNPYVLVVLNVVWSTNPPLNFAFSQMSTVRYWYVIGRVPLTSMKRNTIKIMPCVEGDRSDCQPQASSIAGSRSLSITHLVYLCTLGPFVKCKEMYRAWACTMFF